MDNETLKIVVLLLIFTGIIFNVRLFYEKNIKSLAKEMVFIQLC